MLGSSKDVSSSMCGRKFQVQAVFLAGLGEYVAQMRHNWHAIVLLGVDSGLVTGILAPSFERQLRSGVELTWVNIGRQAA